MKTTIRKKDQGGFQYLIYRTPHHPSRTTTTKTALLPTLIFGAVVGLLPFSTTAQSEVVASDDFSNGLNSYDVSGRIYSGRYGVRLRGGNSEAVMTSAAIDVPPSHTLTLDIAGETRGLDAGEQLTLSYSLNGQAFTPLASESSLSGQARYTISDNTGGTLQLRFTLQANGYFENATLSNFSLSADGTDLDNDNDNTDTDSGPVDGIDPIDINDPIYQGSNCVGADCICDQSNSRTPTYIGAAKLIVSNLEESKRFFTDILEMREIAQIPSDPAIKTEVIMGFSSGGKIVLTEPNPSYEAPVEHSLYPTVQLFTPDFNRVKDRLDRAGYSYESVINLGTFRVMIAREPSGNGVEILYRSGEAVLGGSKLIVKDRRTNANFYESVFNAEPGQTFSQRNVYDEVLMEFNSGPFLAQFQPLEEAPLAKSEFPVTTICTSELENIERELMSAGYGYQAGAPTVSGKPVIIANDPSDNKIQVIGGQ